MADVVVAELVIHSHARCRAEAQEKCGVQLPRIRRKIESACRVEVRGSGKNDRGNRRERAKPQRDHDSADVAVGAVEHDHTRDEDQKGYDNSHLLLFETYRNRIRDVQLGNMEISSDKGTASGFEISRGAEPIRYDELAQIPAGIRGNGPVPSRSQPRD